MSDTTPNDGNTTPATDATPEFREPGSIDYEAAPSETAGASSNDDGANSDVTLDEVRTDPPVTADPPAVDGEVNDDGAGHDTLADGSVAHTNPAYLDKDDDRGEDRNYDRVAATAYEPPAEEASEPVAEPVKRETYVPAASVGAVATGGVSTGSTTDASSTTGYPEYVPTPPVQQTPIYVQAPTAPKNRGNRGAGILIALLATVVYAAIYAGVAYIIAAVNSSTLGDTNARFGEFMVRPVFYIPVIFFFLAFILLIAIVNRGGWWAYVLFGFLVAVVVYFSYIGGALLTVQAWNLTPSEAGRLLGTLWLNPFGIAAAVIAREVPIWAGAWIARRGRKVTARNIEAREEYDRQIAAGPQLARS